MRRARMALYPSVLLLALILAGCATSGKVVTVKKGDLKITLTRDGEFIAADPVELKYWPEAFKGELRVEEVAKNGKAVKKGDVLLRFEKEDAEAALKTKEIDLKEARMQLQNAKAAMDQLDEDMKLAMFTAEKESKDAAKAQDSNLKKEIPLEDDQHAYQRQGSEDSIKEQKEEIEQLVKMYSEDELTEETEEIVLNRAKRRLERAIAGLKLSDRRHDFTLETDRPKKIEDLALAVRTKDQALEKLKTTQKNQRPLKEAALQKQELAVEKQSVELERLRKDIEGLVIRAPISGILLHGEAGAQTPTTLEVKDTCKPYTVLLTIVKPGQVNARCTIEEKDRFRVRDGMPVTVHATALPGTELSGTLKPLDLLPAKAGEWNAVAELKEAEPQLLPGMKCKMDIVLDKVENVLMVPKAAVEREGGKNVCLVKTGERRHEVREVEVGKTDGTSVVIQKGLEQGDEILVKPDGDEKK